MKYALIDKTTNIELQEKDLKNLDTNDLPVLYSYLQNISLSIKNEIIARSKSTAPLAP